MVAALLRSRRFIRATAQALFVGSLVAVIAGGSLIAHANLQKQNITSGFSFLFKSAGWDLNFSLLPTDTTDPYWWYLLCGLTNTIFAGTLSLSVATVIGLVVGLARTSEIAPARLLGTIYVETFRNIPLVVQVFFWYAVASHLPPPRSALHVGSWLILSGRGVYVAVLHVTALSAALAAAVVAAAAALLVRVGGVDGRRRRQAGIVLAAVAGVAVILAMGRIADEPLLSRPALQGLNIQGGLRVPPELYSLVVAIAVYGGAYVAEIVRGGFQAVGRGQSEAARALGLTPWLRFTRVTFPLALRAMLPILTNQYVWLIKATTLGIAVGFSDFFMVVAGVITHSGQTIEMIGILMGGFLLINFSLAAVMNRINRAIALKGSQLRS